MEKRGREKGGEGCRERKREMYIGAGHFSCVILVQ